MSPGATFERVYLALKQMVVSGAFPPGAQLEPASLSETLVASITPVRDALHRLVGERLVQTPRNDGFRMPIYTEASLRDMYGWNLRLLQMALHGHAILSAGDRLKAVSEPEVREPVDEIAAIFQEVARFSGSAELAAAVRSINDRLHVARSCEGSLLPVLAETDELRPAVTAQDLPLLRRLIAAYHRRRIAKVALLLEQLQPNL